MSYHVRLITHNQPPGHGKIEVIYLSGISIDAVSLRNDGVRLFYSGQFNGHHIRYIFRIAFHPSYKEKALLSRSINNAQ